MASSYERELRAVLAGSEKGVNAVTKSCSALEKARAMKVIQKPFLVVRAAGSGIEGSGDIVALRGDLSFPIEVKTSSKKKLYLSGRTMAQYLALQKEGNRCGLMPLYAFRLKGVRGDSWRIFRVETNNLRGKSSVLMRRIPSFPLTKNGNPMLDWDLGLPLHKFLSVVCGSESVSQNISKTPTYENKLEVKVDLIETQDKPLENEPMWVKRFRN
tara:strand:+ start:173 stop:814 length:642 start_codon:yes stop_codon:yes gene_type:complete